MCSAQQPEVPAFPVSGPLLQQGSKSKPHCLAPFPLWLLSTDAPWVLFILPFPDFEKICSPSRKRTEAFFFSHLDEFLVYIRFNFSWRFYIVIEMKTAAILRVSCYASAKVRAKWNLLRVQTRTIFRSFQFQARLSLLIFAVEKRACALRDM